MSDPYVYRHDRPALGCIGRCKVCGRAIQLRRTYAADRWLHFGWADHVAILNPGVCDA